MDNYVIYFAQFIIVLFSLSVHEAAHAWAAFKFGDDTAKDEGRISLNPLVHIDPFATVLLPLMLIMVHSPVVIGSAKPTPVNYNNIKDKRLGMAAISFAGPFSNFLLAAIALAAIKLGLDTGAFVQVLFLIALINIVLGVFNLIPIPPLDGSKILASVLPEDWWPKLFSLERWGFILVIIFLYLGILEKIYYPILYFFFKIFGLEGV